MDVFGNKIIEIRKRLGLTQRELAIKLGVTDKSVSKWERGVALPDISILIEMSKLFGVSLDVLLGLQKESKINPEFISLEKYLMGYFGYRVPDYHPVGEETVLLMMCPDIDDASHGVCLSGKSGERAYEFLFDEKMPAYNQFSKLGRFGVTYACNVPLFSPGGDLDKLCGELEYTRLGSKNVNLYILEKFTEKMTSLVECETIKVIALGNEFVKRYFGWYISSVPFSVLTKIQTRIADGSLRFLFVGPPLTWNASKASLDLLKFKELIKK